MKNSNKLDEFKRELEVLVNKYSLDNDTNTPDYILAEYLYRCLFTFENTVRLRDFHDS